MDFLEVGWGCMDCVALTQDRDRCWALVNAVIYLRVQSNAETMSCELLRKDSAPQS
jgi:hypothetical protein